LTAAAIGSLTFEQAALIVLLLVLMVVFALERFRVELVALAGLAVGFALGLVPAGSVFSGFSNPAVITVAEVLLIIQTLARSRTTELVSARIMRLVRSERQALALLCGVSAFLSVFMNNIGALALMLPVAISLSAHLGVPVRRTLMPVSFATLLGGVSSLIGTPANFVVSETRASFVGRPFALFDLAYVGVPVAVAGVALLVLLAPRMFRERGVDPSPGRPEKGTNRRRLVTEIRVAPGSPFAGAPIPAIEAAFAARVLSVLRDGKRLFGRPDEQVLAAGDVLVADIPAAALAEACKAGSVEPMRTAASAAGAAGVEAVLMPQSIFIGSRVGTLEPLESRGIAVVGVVPQRARVEGRLADVQLGIGDILILDGPEDAIDEALEEADLLRLSERQAAAPKERSLLTVAAFSIGVLVAAFGLLPPEIALGFVVLTLALTGALPLREGLQNLNWPILIMLVAMIPLGAAVETTGTARTLSHALLGAVPSAGPVAIVGGVLLLSVAVTQFVNNVSTAAVLGPIAVEAARASGLPPDPLLIAVALGASLDFLTPFGHHNNTLVMGIAGYRFVDFPRLGAPLLLLALVVGVAGILLVWL
jgi:di/tricarboxylate transporter